MASDDMNNEKDWYQVHTANEDGWTEYHEEDDETDDFDIAIKWLLRSDVVWGEIRYNGEVVAWTEEKEDYDPDYDRTKNIIMYADGWGRRGKIASTKKSTATESMPSYHSGIGLDDVSDADMREKIDTVMAGLDYMDEPWKGRLSRVCDDWKAGKISTYECYNEISDIEYRQSVSIKSTKKMKKSASSIHDMIAQTRANNNSLVKSRVDLHKNLSSVGPSYKNDSLVKNFNGDIRDYVHVGDIYYTSWGYDMTIVQFYEVISLVGKQTAVLRELNANVENDYGRGDGRATPILGSYDGGEFRARATNSYYNESPVAFIVDSRHHAIKWDGEPKYYNTWD